MRASDVTRRGLLAAVSPGTALVLAACGGAPPAPEAGAQRAARPARLSWLPSATGNRLTLHQRQVARFKELTGHDVELVSTTGDYMEKLVALLAAGSAADIFRLESGFLPGLVTKGQLQPLDAYLKRDAVDLKDFFETGITMYQWQTRQYALPWLAFRALLYNADLLKQHGVAPPPNDWKDAKWTWDAFLTALRRVQQGTGGPDAAAANPGGAVWPFNGPGQFLDAWIWVLGSGGDLFSKDERTLALDQPAALEGLQFYADLMARHKVHPTPTQQAQDPEQMTFLNGRAAFYLGAVNTVGRLQNASFTCHAAPAPWGKGGTHVTGGGHSWPMNSASTEKDATWELQKFLGSKENDLLQVLSGEAPPYRKSTSALKEWKERTPPANPETLAEGAAYLKPQPKVPTWSEINRELNTGLKPALEGERTARDVVLSLKPKLTQLLDQGWRDVPR